MLCKYEGRVKKHSKSFWVFSTERTEEFIAAVGWELDCLQAELNSLTDFLEEENFKCLLVKKLMELV